MHNLHYDMNITCSFMTIIYFRIRRIKLFLLLTYYLGVKLRNMKMGFNTGGTWRQAMNTNDEN